MYSERLLELFRSREHGGALERATHFAEAGAPGGGPWVQIRLRVDAGMVREARWRTYGCPAAIACSEAACRWAESRRLSELPRLTPALLSAEVGGVPEGKEHCPDLASRAMSTVRAIGLAHAEAAGVGGASPCG